MWPFSENNTGDSSSSSASTSIGRRQEAAPHPVGADASADQCPVDHETRSVWLAQQRNGQKGLEQGQSRGQGASTSAAYAFLGSEQSAQGSTQTANTPAGLSTDRVVSSIPRFSMWQQASGDDNDSLKKGPASASDGPRSDASPVASSSTPDPSSSKNWVYPSPSQFYAAMERKKHNPRAEDMSSVVPIHNAVNERAWQHILQWEHLADGGASLARCGGPKLVSFKGRPKDVTWRAWYLTLSGYTAPFDRHDWVVDRCGKRVTYVIDFYSGQTPAGSGSPPGLSFFLDVRPSPGQVEGIRMRLKSYWERGIRGRTPPIIQ